ncbi:MAG: hypothetical protein II982_03840 [Clostridia bacterium]|nr:hypothetical protein [Clostridia bacterium]
MKKSTRILALILTLLMVFSAVPMSAMADAVSSEFNFTLDDSMVTNVVRATTSVDGDTINVVSESGEQTSSMRIKFRLPDGASVAFADGADATYATFATANVLELKNPGVGRLNLPLTLTDSQGVTKTVMLKADFGNKVRYITNCTVAQNGDTLTVASGSATAYVVFDTTGIDGAYVEVENVSRNLLERYVTVGTEAIRFYNPVYDEGYVTVNIKNGDGETVRSYDVNVVFHQGKDANGNYIVSEYTPVLQTLRAIYAVDGDTIKVTANAGVTNVYINFGRYQAETLTASLNNNFVKKTGARSWRVMNTGSIVEFDVYFDATASGGELVTRHVEVDFTNKVPDKVTGVSATVEVDGNGTVKNEVSMSGETYNATVPAGVAVESDTLTLSVSEMESTGNIVADEMDMLQSYDVHVEGVSKENDVAIIVTLGEILPIGMNKGNVVLYHIENGVTNVMTQVFSLDELDAHNEFYYDPATGIVTVAMATFSEIAVASDSARKWEGEVDYNWYNAEKTELTIANADQLVAFSRIVGGMASADNKDFAKDSFAGKTVNLVADINLNDLDSENGKVFYPIGYYNNVNSFDKVPGGTVESNVTSFSGTFDGNGHTIKNFYQNTWEMFGDYNSGYSGTPNHYDDAMGLFGYVVNGTVKNLTVDNFSSDGEFTPTGVIAAYAVNSTFENIAITNCNPRVYNTGNGGIVGIGGNSDDPDTYNLTFTNITIDNTNKITALWGSWDVACGGLVGMFRGAGHAHMTNCHVAAQIDVYNDVCGNYQYYWYRYSGMMIGTNKNMVTDKDGYTVPETTKFHAENCTVHFGDWNNYWYCELVANSLASYTHDHQFSRLTRVDSVDVENKTVTVGGVTTAIPAGRQNYVVVTGRPYSTEFAECYHFVDGEVWYHEDAGTEVVNGETVLKENNAHIYLPFNQLFTGYGWGVKHIPVYNGENYAFEGITILDREVADSVEKFEQANPVVDTVNNEDVYTVSDFFTAKAGAEINESGVYVTIDKINEDDTVTWTYTEADNWEDSTIEFDNVGSIRLTIQDYDYCTPTVLYINVADPAEEDKFAAKTDLEFKREVEGEAVVVELGKIFTALDGVTINSENVTVDVSGAEYTENTTDWTQGKLSFAQTGEYTVSITDNDLCKTATATVSIKDPAEEEHFTTIFKNTDDYMYRVGNDDNTPVKLGSLFKVKDDNYEPGMVTVEVEAIAGNVSGTYEANSTWTNGTINFDGTGVVEVTIDDNKFTKEYTLYLEVVDAVNATTATSATSNNVVLLNDITSGFTVSGRYTFYGNGFTLNYTGDGQYLNNGLKQGIVTVSENGTLDNLRIKASIYPKAYMYYDEAKSGPSSVEGDKTRYHYQLSAVVAKGNATISNCYIYGARNNIFVDTGDVTIKDTVLECGTLANIQIQSTRSHTVILENVTTIQHQVNATIGDTSAVMLGAGVVVGPDMEENPKIVLRGDFKQYNWVNSGDADAVSIETAKSIINAALDATEFNHDVNGENASNLGVIYLNTSAVEVTNNTGLPYVLADVKVVIQGVPVDGQVYSLQNATESQIYSDYANADRSTVNGDYLPTFTFDLGDQQISYDGESDTRYMYVVGDGVTALYQDGEEPLALDLSNLATIYKYTGNNYRSTVKCKDPSGNELTASNNVVTLVDDGEYTLEFTVEDNLFYDKDGKPITKSVTRIYTVPLSLTVKEASIKNAEVSITKTALDGVYTTVNLTDYKLRINFLDCISVIDYTKEGSGGTVDLSSDISSATLTPASVNVFTTASTITVTYTDGRELTVNLSVISGSSPGTKTALVNTSGGLYFITDGALNNKPTEASSQNKCTITSVSFKGRNGSTVTNYTDVTVTWALGSSSGCFAEGTLITLADGTKKAVEDITYEDELLAWDFNTGAYAVTTPSLIENHEKGEYRVINLAFEDGTTVRIVVDHGFFDVEENNFVYIDEENVDSYIGHDFVKTTEDGAYTTTKLVGYTITTEEVSYHTIQTAFYNNCIAEDMFTLTSPPEMLENDEWFDYFEIGEGMKYDEEKMQADIEKYGLYTYEDFAEYVTYEQFIAFNGPYLKVLVGRGVLTYDDILEIISTYVNPAE